MTGTGGVSGTGGVPAAGGAPSTGGASGVPDAGTDASDGTFDSGSPDGGVNTDAGTADLLKPTPIDGPLTIRARVKDMERGHATVSCSVFVNDEETARAESHHVRVSL